LFAKFGSISKCKLETYADGLSRGFCYVQFELEKDAKAAIESLNGTEFLGKKLEVFLHQKRTNPKNETSQKAFNNIFVQGLPQNSDVKKLE